MATGFSQSLIVQLITFFAISCRIIQLAEGTKKKDYGPRQLTPEAEAEAEQKTPVSLKIICLVEHFIFPFKTFVRGN